MGSDVKLGFRENFCPSTVSPPERSVTVGEHLPRTGERIEISPVIGPSRWFDPKVGPNLANLGMIAF